MAAGSKLRTSVYIDGFNLFHGCLKDGPHRWLDLAAFCRASLPGDHVNCIRYFTAVITARPGHPNATQHQLTYLRALATIPNLSIDYGHFLTGRTRMKPVQGRGTVEVWKTEEKGSDVNIATRMLCDAFDGQFDVAVIVSNDSGLLPPLREIKRRFGLPVGVINPQIGFPDPSTGRYPRPTTSYALKREATFYRPVRPSVLAATHFPRQFADAVGTI